MANWAIDDQRGTNICGGIQLEHRARAVAQDYANDLGAPVLLYSSEGAEELIEPAGDEPAQGLGYMQGRR